jgi:phosphopantothenoylcysteine decarboxylase/phosphopantothenate--cysteine ligase
VARLREFGYRIVEPEEGQLASGMTGKGRLAGLDRIVEATVEALSGARPAEPSAPAKPAAAAATGATGPAPWPAALELSRPGVQTQPAAPEPHPTTGQAVPKPSGPTDLSGLHVVVTAGGTAEPIDPVRFVGNRSSGKMGIAIAQAALDRGAAVTVILGNASVEPPAQAHVARAETAAEMQAALRALTPPAGPLFDVLVMAAAVADFRPRTAADHKIARSEGLALDLEPTPDLLAETADRVRTGIRASGLARPVLVGFAAETGSFKRAAEKLKSKGVDFLVANDVSEPGSGFGTETNRVTIYSTDGPPEELPLMTKREVAEALLNLVAVKLKLDSSANGANLDLPTTFPSGLSHKEPIKSEPAEVDR